MYKVINSLSIKFPFVRNTNVLAYLRGLHIVFGLSYRLLRQKVLIQKMNYGQGF